MLYVLNHLPTVLGILITFYSFYWLYKIYKYISTKRKIKKLIGKHSPQQNKVLSRSEITELAKLITEGKFHEPEAMDFCVRTYIRKKNNTTKTSTERAPL